MLDRTLRTRYLQAARELRRYFNGESFRADTPERAFIKWYITARFGKLGGGSHVLSDGTNDGGIDSIVFHEGAAIAFQMKYERRPRIGAVRRDELAGFEKIAKLFKDKDRTDEFTAWLDTVRPDLHASYRKLFGISNEALRFVFVTSQYAELTSTTVEIQDIQKVLSLWSLYREGFTPPTETIRLVMENTWYAKSDDGFATYVGLADVQDFLRLMKDDKNERLFAQNVRTDLGSTINTKIKETYEENPEEFWLGNNGIYVVCRAVTASGSRFELTFPSIINGSQTLHTIASSKKRHVCRILVRILEMDVIGNPKLLGEVIRHTNTQNPMNRTNLVAHDPFQLNVARYLDQYTVFYERREKEWINERKNILTGYIPLKSKELGQWLSILNPSIGMGLARNKVSELFVDEDLYGEIFGGFDSDLRSSRYRDLVSVVWAGLLVKSFIRTSPSKKRALYQIPRLLLIRAVTEAVKSNKGLQNQVTEALHLHRVGKQKIPAALSQHLKRAVKKFRSLQRRAQRKDSSVDYSNFFKNDKHSADAYHAAFSTSRIKGLTATLRRNLDRIA
ncbi:MAG: AIPR family protein [Candidatus Acidiferrales bacterium]